MEDRKIWEWTPEERKKGWKKYKEEHSIWKNKDGKNYQLK